MQDQLTKELKFTGTQINYYIICPTKLWYFSHFLQMEHSSDLVSLGKLLHETSYSKQKKEVLIDSKIGIDFIKKGNKIILHDIKKSKKMEKAHEYQLLYYIYYLKQKGIESEGIINYPLQRQIAEVKLTEDKEKEIVKIIEEIPKIMSLEKPPKPEKKRYCRKCSYFEFCWS